MMDRKECKFNVRGHCTYPRLHDENPCGEKKCIDYPHCDRYKDYLKVAKRTLSTKEINALADIFDIGVPYVYARKNSHTPFMPGLYFLELNNSETTEREIYECRGYHRRLLLSVKGDAYFFENTLSPYMEGIFQYQQDVTNRYSSHPLIEDAYRRELLDPFFQPRRSWEEE